MTEYQKQVSDFNNTKNRLERKSFMTDYEMQLFLHGKGHELYNEKINNQVDMEELHRLGEFYGYECRENVDYNYIWFVK